MKKLFLIAEAIAIVFILVFAITACVNNVSKLPGPDDAWNPGGNPGDPIDFGVPEGPHAANYYYIDNSGGSDSNNGLSADRAFKSFVPLDAVVFGPGDMILLKAGTIINSTFKAHEGEDGNSADPVILTGYGSGRRPVIKMKRGDLIGINITNVQYWEVRGIEVTSEPADTAIDTNLRAGILVYNRDRGQLNHLVIDNCYVHNIDTFSPGNGQGIWRVFGGILVNPGRNPDGAGLNKFDDLQILNNRVEDSKEGGIFCDAWAMPVVYTPGWYVNGPHIGYDKGEGLSTNALVRGNSVYRAGGDGIMFGWMDHGLVEYNTIAEACYNRNSAYAALWFTQCYNCVIQYNEVYGTKFNADGMALDDDNVNGNNIYQYNYTHDNEGGFFMTMGQGQNVIVRYNISVNDGSSPNNSPNFPGGSTRLIQSVVQGMQFYNNIIYTPRSTMGGGADLISWGWDGPDIYAKLNVTFANNIFYLNGSGAYFWGGGNPEPPIGVTFDSNLYWGQAVLQGNFIPPTRDVNRIIADPVFAADGGFPGPWDPAWIGVETAKRLFKLREGSPAIGAGARLGQGVNGFTEDFFGNSFGTDRISIGADQTTYSSTPQLNSIIYASAASVKVYMNIPIADQSRLSLVASVNGGAYNVVPITSVNIDSVPNIAALGFDPLVSGAGYTVNFKAYYNGKDPTPVYTLKSVNHSDNSMVLKFTNWDAGSSYGSSPVQMACNGAGLTGYTPQGLHDNEHYGQTMWMTDDGAPVSTAWIEGGFGTEYLLSAIYIWNYNQVGLNFPNDYDLTNRGLKNVKVEYQDSAGVWHEIPNGTATGYPFTIPKADGSPAMPYSLRIDVTGKSITAQGIIAQGIIAQAIRITADPSAGNGNYGGDHYGLSEIMATGGLDTDYEVYTASAVGGVVTSDVSGVVSGGTVLITITAENGYVPCSVFVNGIDMTSGVSAGELVISGITSDVQVAAIFKGAGL